MGVRESVTDIPCGNDIQILRFHYITYWPVYLRIIVETHGHATITFEILIILSIRKL